MAPLDLVMPSAQNSPDSYRKSYTVRAGPQDWNSEKKECLDFPILVEFLAWIDMPRFEEFNDRPSLQKIPELFDSESVGLEESGATRIFNGYESLLIPGGRPNSMEFAISQACRLSKERPVRISKDATESATLFPSRKMRERLREGDKRDLHDRVKYTKFQGELHTSGSGGRQSFGLGKGYRGNCSRTLDLSRCPQPIYDIFIADIRQEGHMDWPRCFSSSHKNYMGVVLRRTSQMTIPRNSTVLHAAIVVDPAEPTQRFRPDCRKWAISCFYFYEKLYGTHDSQ
ncbi:hypothetical protein L6452_17736 [Arctium lappa]|uniref:Uncharacterized protein n=1 Tax=Arctium lappa TaxID=4217 RepID=A0ACB9C4D6_ARCLA|nr:hypothetical protein L6452_17736 [Arctium lappa]